jgi:hypothetical protein
VKEFRLERRGCWREAGSAVAFNTNFLTMLTNNPR